METFQNKLCLPHPFFEKEISLVPVWLKQFLTLTTLCVARPHKFIRDEVVANASFDHVMK